MAKKRSQDDKIYDYLLTHPIITQAMATEIFNITRLSARIYDLKQLGIAIGSRMVYYTKKDGSTGKYAEYWLEI